VLRFPLPIFISRSAPCPSVIRAWNNGRASGQRTKWTQSDPTARNEVFSYLAQERSRYGSVTSDGEAEPKYSEKTSPSTTLSTTNPTWPDLGSNPGRRGGKSETNRLSYGMAISIYLSIYLSPVTPTRFIRHHNASFHFSVLILRETVWLLGRGISPTQGRYLHTGQHKHRIITYTHQTSMPCVGFDPHDPSFWASEDSSCLRSLDNCDRQLCTCCVYVPKCTGKLIPCNHRIRISFIIYSVL
jgi:hypothetical protein